MFEKTRNRKHFGRVSAFIAGCILGLCGWRVVGERPTEEKFVAIAAPHTRTWDLFLSLITAIHVRIPMVFMMKKEAFWWPARVLWYALGGFPIDRAQRKDIVPTMVRAFSEFNRMALVITPEGTRDNVSQWKSGFYWIAVRAGVPIKLLWIGNEDRVAGFGPMFYPTGDIHADYAQIRAFYERTLGRSMPAIVPPPNSEPPYEGDAPPKMHPPEST